MVKVITDNQYYIEIANAIRTKNGSEETYTPAEMAAAIEAIESEIELYSTIVSPTGEEFTETAEDGFGFSAVTVEGDENLIPENILKDVTIYGVTGLAECSSAQDEEVIPAAYTSYVAAAKNLYAGDYTGLMIMDSGANVISVCFFLDNFDILSYDESNSGKFSMVGAVYCKYTIDTDQWAVLDYSDYESSGEHYAVFIQYATRILYYDSLRIWPETPVSLSEITLTPTGTEFTQTAAAGTGYSAVTVSGDENLTPGNILKGVTIYGVTGTATSGIGSGASASQYTALLIDKSLYFGPVAYYSGVTRYSDVLTVTMDDITGATNYSEEE